MMRLFVRPRLLHPSQAGFTLIEVIVAMAITGILGAGVAITIFQIESVADSSNAHMTAVNQVQNALHYINRDVQMAQTVTPGMSPNLLTLKWTNWDDNKAIQVKYLNQNGDLIRQYSENGGAPTSTTVAQFISTNATDTNSSYDLASHKLTIKLTASALSGSEQASETRVCEIIPRPGS